MFEITGIGSFDKVSAVVVEILEQNLAALAKRKANGWDINAPIKVGDYCEILPIGIALRCCKYEVMHWLVEQGVNLNDKSDPSFLLAVRYCDEAAISYLVAHGADVNSIDRLKSDAYKHALYGKQREHLVLINKLGHSAIKHGGAALRMAVGKSDFEAAKIMLELGADINFNSADQIYPFKPTPLCVAARYGTLEMCRWLVEQGADARLGEKDGMRPYAIAVERGEMAMAEYFRTLEPKEFHSVQNKLDELRKFRLSSDLIEFLQSEDLRLNLTSKYIKFIDFFALADTFVMKFNRREFVRLSRQTDEYSDLIFVWDARVKGIACYDIEHKEMINLGSFKQLASKSGELIDEMIFG